MSRDLELTLKATATHGWELVRLHGHGKKPVGLHWQTTKDALVAASWIESGCNAGNVCHARNGLAVLDPDNVLAWADMIDTLRYRAWERRALRVEAAQLCSFVDSMHRLKRAVNRIRQRRKRNQGGFLNEPYMLYNHYIFDPGTCSGRLANRLS